MPMMMSQIFKSGFQKNENLDILKTKHCFSSNKRTITNQGLLYCKNNFVLEVTLKCQSTVVVLVVPLAAAGRGSYEIGSVHPSSWCLLGWGFFGKVFLFPKNCGNGPKIGFFVLKEKFGHKFSLNLFYNESLYYLLCSCTNPLFGKSVVPEMWVKVPSAIQIARFLNQPFLQNKLMKQPHFWHVDTKSEKLKGDWKFFGWAWPASFLKITLFLFHRCFSNILLVKTNYLV